MNKNNRSQQPGGEDRVAQLINEADRLGALSDPNVFSLLGALTANPGDNELLSLVVELLQPYRIREALMPDPFRPYPGPQTGLDQGDLEIGTICETGLLWRVPHQSMPHWLIVGPTGRGKTRLLCGLLQQLNGKIPFVFITIKSDTARLLVDPPILHYALQFSELRLSLFEPPPGTSEEDWQREIVELVCKIWGLQYSRAVLHEACDKLRDLYHRYSQHQGAAECFTLANLHDMVLRSKSKYQEGAATALQMLRHATGDSFECSKGMPVRDLLFRGSCAIMIPRLHDDRVARFFVDWLMEWAYNYLEFNGPNDATPLVAFALDDAHRFLSQSAEKDGLMPLSHRYLIIRQAGLRIIAVSHCPTDLAPAILSQSGIITQVGGLAYQRDVLTMAGTFGMTPFESDRLQEPNVGDFIARENLDRYKRPFAGTVCHFPSPTIPFSEADRQRLMQPLLLTLPWKPAVPLAVVEAAMRTPVQGAVPARFPCAISQDALALAADVLSCPWDYLNARYARLGKAGRPGQQAKDELVTLGWVKEHAIPKQGRPPILLEPLPPLGAALQRPLPSWGKGGFLHAFSAQAVMKQLAARGFTGIEHEKFYGSKAVDVVGIHPAGHLVGVEVCISLTNVVDNLQKDWLVMPGFASILVVCLGLAEVRQAQRAVAMAPGLNAYLRRIVVEPLAKWL